MQFIDSHCHIDFEQFDRDRETLLNNCQQRGVTQIIIPAVTQKGWQKLVTLCQQYSMLSPTLGLHPLFLEQHSDQDLVELEKLIPQVKPVAIGEIGLDFYIEHPDKPKQIKLFTQQLELAKQFELPVIIHVRKAHDQVYSLLKQVGVRRGVIHAFSGSLQQAENYMSQGFLLGAGGILSYQKATRVKAVFSQIPLNYLVLETDAPDMPLQDKRGQRNSPEYIPEIASLLADIKQETLDTIATKTTENVQTLFSI